MNLAHKIRLNPTELDVHYFKKACGVARFTWNWALNEWNKQYQSGKKPNAFSLKKEFNALKKGQFPWIFEVTKYASQQPFIFLGNAFANFFKDRKKPKKAGQFRYPQFKKKGKCRDSFYIGGDQVKVLGNQVKIPNLGWVEMTETLRWTGNIQSATITRHADKWFVSFCIETTIKPEPCKNQASIGVDLGVLKLATLSDGVEVEGSKPLKFYKRRLKRVQRQRARKTTRSNNFAKASMREARLHYKIYCIRKDSLHKLSTQLTENYRYICIEDLHVKGMMANHKLARAISDMSFYEFKRQLLYKAQMKGNTVLMVDRFFASSKLCSRCDAKNEDLTLSVRIFHCNQCDLKINRDLNASRNLEKQLYTESSSGIYACGQDGSYDLKFGNRKPAWMNQENEFVQMVV